MVVGAVGTPVLFHHTQIEVPALDFPFSASQHFQSTFGDCDWRQPGRAREALLCATVSEIDSVIVDSHWMTTQRSDTVHQQQSIWKIAQYLANHGQWRKHTGGGFSMDHCKDLDLSGLQH